MPSRPSQPPRSRRSSAGPPNIRWDRLGRYALLFLFAMIAYLYIGPMRSWISAYGEAQKRRGDVAQLKAENNRLKDRAKELSQASSLEQEARRLGMVKLGERAYVIEGLPASSRR